MKEKLSNFNIMENKKIRVLIILSRIIIGGAVNCVYFLAKHLPKDKYSVEIVGGGISDGEINMADMLSKEGIKVHKIDSMKRDISLKNDIISVIELYKIIREIKPHIISTHTAKAGAVGRIAAALNQTPVILHTFHGHTFRHYFSPAKTMFYIMVEKFLARISSHIITISPLQLYDLSVKFKIAPQSKFRLIPIAIDIERFNHIKKNKTLATSLGIPPERKIIGMIARFVPIKNIPMIFKVLKRLIDSGQDVHLVLVGDGTREYQQFLKDMCTDMELDSYVDFTGWRLDVETVYACLDVFALTSLNEGTPITILEAMAANVPVVATDVGGVRDILIDNRNGLLCRSDDPEDMAQKINELLLHDAKANTLCKNAKEFVKRNHHYSVLIENVNKLYTELVVSSSDNSF